MTLSPRELKLVLAEAVNITDRDDIIEMCAKVADDYARDGRIYKEYACETADELAARIRGLKSSDATGEAG